MGQALTVLGIESSCDDTAVAVVSHIPGQLARIHSSVVAGQGSLHAAFGGVVPEIAARAHAERLDHCTERALSEAECSLGGVDAVAVTAGPGLIGGLLAGVSFAKGLCAAAGKPLLGINHLAGHALTARMTDGIGFPYLALIASGGHCQFQAVLGADQFLRLGGTLDDAPGEAFDKSARLLGLPQPGGPSIEAAAADGDPARFDFPRPLSGRQGCNMSFSGLKTALLLASEGLPRRNGKLENRDVADICAGFQAAVRDVIVEKSARALEEFQSKIGRKPEALAAAGGVIANGPVRTGLAALCGEQRTTFLAPEPRYCTDNGAMIAWAGIERFRLGLFDDFTLAAHPRWPLDAASPPLSSHGKRGAKS